MNLKVNKQNKACKAWVEDSKTHLTLLSRNLAFKRLCYLNSQKTIKTNFHHFEKKGDNPNLMKNKTKRGKTLRKQKKKNVPSACSSVGS